MRRSSKTFQLTVVCSLSAALCITAPPPGAAQNGKTARQITAQPLIEHPLPVVKRGQRLGITPSAATPPGGTKRAQILRGVPAPQPQPEHPALATLNQLPVKGRAPTTGYSRAEFPHWTTTDGCNVADHAMHKAARGQVTKDGCDILTAELPDLYSNKPLTYQKGAGGVDVDHVVSLKNAWVTGAQQLTREQRRTFANDQLNLIATSATLNRQTGSADAASWLPPFKPFRCEYLARQVTVKAKYQLWVTSPEKTAMSTILATCPA